MTSEPTTAPLLGGVALLERAANYVLGVLHLVTPDMMRRRTPCTNWDVAALLAHLDDSLIVLHGAADLGQVELELAECGPGPDLACEVRDRIAAMLGAWINTGSRRAVSVDGLPLTTGLVSAVGAVELAVHGWDLAQGCNIDRPIPAALAEELLELAPFLVSPADRPARFAEPRSVPPLSGPSDRLVAFLGRTATT